MAEEEKHGETLSDLYLRDTQELAENMAEFVLEEPQVEPQVDLLHFHAQTLTINNPTTLANTTNIQMGPDMTENRNTARFLSQSANLPSYRAANPIPDVGANLSGGAFRTQPLARRRPPNIITRFPQNPPPPPEPDADIP